MRYVKANGLFYPSKLPAKQKYFFIYIVFFILIVAGVNDFKPVLKNSILLNNGLAGRI